MLIDILSHFATESKTFLIARASPPQNAFATAAADDADEDPRHHHKVIMTMTATPTRLPRRTLVLGCIAFIQLLSQSFKTTAFAPPVQILRRAPTTRIFASSPQSSLETVTTSTSTSTTTAAETWIQEGIEHYVKGEAVIDDQCIVGPKHVLIYDTTLRGKNVDLDALFFVL